MEASSSSSSRKPSDPPPPTPSASAAASKLLRNLPSRGLFSSTTILSNPGGLRVYVCDHDTAPPEEQVIKTNQTNILIRSLTLNKNRSEAKVNGENSRKRPHQKTHDGRSKRVATSSQLSSRHETLNSHTPLKEYHNLTVERLRGLLKERGLSVKGKKDELVTRLREDDSNHQE